MVSKDKLYYSIGEVKELTGVEPHVLRYWESEFPTFRPRKNRNGQRAYSKKDIDLIMNIKRLLYDEKFTIKGAKSKLKSPAKKNKKEEELVLQSDQQLVFGEIEKQTDILLSDKDYLTSIKDKLNTLSTKLKKMNKNF